jgi:hypothetical protein
MLLSAFVASQLQGYMKLFHNPITLVCQAPMVSAYWSYWPCNTQGTSANSDVVVDFSKLTKVQGDSFQILLEESVGMSEVDWDLKVSEVVVSNLVRLVRVSDIRSKAVLVDILATLTQEIKATSNALRRLHSAIIWAAQR